MFQQPMIIPAVSSNGGGMSATTIILLVVLLAALGAVVYFILNPDALSRLAGESDEATPQGEDACAPRQDDGVRLMLIDELFEPGDATSIRALTADCMLRTSCASACEASTACEYAGFLADGDTEPSRIASDEHEALCASASTCEDQPTDEGPVLCRARCRPTDDHLVANRVEICASAHASEAFLSDGRMLCDGDDDVADGTDVSPGASASEADGAPASEADGASASEADGTSASAGDTESA